MQLVLVQAKVWKTTENHDEVDNAVLMINFDQLQTVMDHNLWSSKL